MKYFKFWVQETFDSNFDGFTNKIKVLAGSNISDEDARKKAQESYEIIQHRILERESKEDYEVPIKEHVDEILDENNIVTICRYGAKVLNTNQYTILDLDDYPVDFMDLFKPLRKLPKKERIVAKFLQRVKKHPELGEDFRIYETCKGIRVIGKQYLDPSKGNFQSLMRKIAVDWIYIAMSKKQNCYRARLTPKPYRMRFRTIKIKSPLDCASENYKAWTGEYAQASESFSVVKLVTTLGRDFSSDSVVRFHDKMCNEASGRKLV